MPNRPVSENSDPKDNWSAQRLAVAWEQSATSLLENLREFLFAPRLRIMPAPAMPLHAQCIWSRDALLPRAQGLSLGFHILIVGLLLIPFAERLPRYGALPPGPPPIFIDPEALREILSVKPQAGGGGGGNRNPIPATRGNLAPFAKFQIVPPNLPKNETAVLLADPTLVGPPEIKLPQIDANNWGLPFADRFTNSDGPGEGGGQGPGKRGGQGPGNGPGSGEGDAGWGLRPPRSGVSVSEVSCVYCPNPGYTEEARKVKFNGSVMLRVVVGADGLPKEIRVTKGVGLGLDESAVRAVSQWKFRPARDTSGRAVTAWTIVEVNFHIY